MQMGMLYVTQQTYSDMMRETPSLSDALTTSLSPCTSLPTRQSVRTSTGGSADEYFDADIVKDEDTLEHDIIDDIGDSSDIDIEGVTTTVGVSAGFIAPLQGVVVADELILLLLVSLSLSLYGGLVDFTPPRRCKSKTAKVVLLETSNWFGN